jgi:uncharacterized repeat protein (TIGR02543 family)
MQFVSFGYDTTDNISWPYRDYNGYIWLYKWDGEHRILKSTEPNGTSFSQVGTLANSPNSVVGDSHGRVFFVAASGSANISYWNGSTFGTFGSETIVYLAVGPDDSLYSIAGTSIKKCVYGNTTFSTYATSPYSAQQIFVDQDNAVYVASAAAKAIQKMPVGGSFSDIGADSLTWAAIKGGVFDGRKYARCSENNYYYRSLDGSDTLSQFAEFDELTDENYKYTVDYYGNIFKCRWDTLIDNKFRIYILKFGFTYNGNGNTSGTVPTDSNTYLSGDTVTTATNSGTLAKTDYRFTGWNTLANGLGTHYAVSSAYPMTADDTVLYAEWTPVYTVTYDDNDSTSGTVPTDATEYITGESATVAGNTGTLAKTGFTFAGWNTLANGTGTRYAPAESYVIAGADVTLYAEWTATLTYDDNNSTSGSAPVDSTEYHLSESATIVGNTGSLARTHYKWLGWNTAADGTGTRYTAGGLLPISGAVTIYAEWEAAKTITYSGNSNTSGTAPTDATEYYTGDTATVAANTGTLARTGYRWMKWNTASDGSGTDRSPAATFTITTSVTLYAKWQATYSVTYYGNNNTSGSVPTDANLYITGETFLASTNSGSLARTNYAFNDWNTTADQDGTAYAVGATVTVASSNISLYASWVVPYVQSAISRFFTQPVHVYKFTASATFPFDNTWSEVIGSPFYGCFSELSGDRARVGGATEARADGFFAFPSNIVIQAKYKLVWAGRTFEIVVPPKIFPERTGHHLEVFVKESPEAII